MVISPNSPQPLNLLIPIPPSLSLQHISPWYLFSLCPTCDLLLPRKLLIACRILVAETGLFGLQKKADLHPGAFTGQVLERAQTNTNTLTVTQQQQLLPAWRARPGPSFTLTDLHCIAHYRWLQSSSGVCSFFIFVVTKIIINTYRSTMGWSGGKRVLQVTNFFWK